MVWFQSGKVDVDMKQVNHFLSKQLYLNIAKDKFYPSYNGWTYDFRLHLCQFDEKYTPSNSPQLNNAPFPKQTHTLTHPSRSHRMCLRLRPPRHPSHAHRPLATKLPSFLRSSLLPRHLRNRPHQRHQNRQLPSKTHMG